MGYTARLMTSILLHGLCAALYLLLGAHFWRTRWHRGGAGQPIAPWERVAVLFPFALHSALLYQMLFLSETLHFGFGQALSVTMWLAVLVYWVENLFISIESMQALILPAAGICAFLPAVFPGLSMPDFAQHFEFRAHLVVAMGAYSLFTLAALHALLMILLERQLQGASIRTGHAGEPNVLDGPFAHLPPLLTLESLLFRMLELGFVLLTLTLLSGVLFSESVFHQAFRFDHKVLFAIVSWLIFAGLLVGRHFYGWRGRRALRWTLTGFAMLLLAYVGSRFVLEVLLGRSLG
jgi:ABC-type uncharacterized transport system permease subunit